MTSRCAGTPPRPNRDQPPPAWHTVPIEDVLRALGSDPDTGLSSTEAAARLAQHGGNELPEAAGRSIGRMVLDQLSDFMIIVLIAAAVVSGLVGEPADTIAVVVIVLLNAVMGSGHVRRDGAPFPPNCSVAL